MKRCSSCGSIVSDSDLICGVCGGDLSQATPVSEDGGAIAVLRVKPHWHVSVPGLSGLSMGIAFVAIGVYWFILASTYESELLSLLPIGFGIFVIAVTRDMIENRRYVTGGGRGRFSGVGGRGVNWKAVEDEEDRKRASGEAD